MGESEKQSDLVEYGAVDDRPDGACVNYDDCGNTVPGRASMCYECLDAVRHKESEK